MPKSTMDYADGTTFVVDSAKEDPTVMQTLSSYEAALNTAAGLKQFLFKQDTLNPEQYLYQFTTQDGRIWRQDIWITPTEARMTFSVSDQFRLAEFTPHRNLRLFVVDLVRKIGVTRIKIDRP